MSHLRFEDAQLTTDLLVLTLQLQMLGLQLLPVLTLGQEVFFVDLRLKMGNKEVDVKVELALLT